RTFPHAGEAALWVSGNTRNLVGTPVRLGAVAVAMAVGWMARERPDPRTLLAALGVSLLARFAFEPVIYTYYLGPGLGFLLVYELVHRGHPWRVAVLGGGWLLWFQIWPATWWWWAVSLVVAAAICGPALLDLVTNPNGTPVPDPLGVAKPRLVRLARSEREEER